MKEPGHPDNPLDSTLVNKLQKGDTSALAQLYQRYFDRLYSFVFHQVGRNREVTEDIVQEVFLKSITSAKRFKGHSSFYTWLCAIAHHKIADFYRTKNRYLGIEGTGVEPSLTELHDPREHSTSSVEADVEHLENHHLIEQVLMRLPWQYREVLVLKYVEELSVFEISQIMGRSPKSIEGLLA